MSIKPTTKKTFLDEGDVVQHLKTLLETATKATFQNVGKSTNEKGKMWKTDGVLKWDNVRLLLEAKFGTDLTKREIRSNVLAQALYYCKRFEERGDEIPNVIFIGDDTHCFALPFVALQEFLNAKIDWTLAPSSPDPKLQIDIDVFLEKTLEVQGSHLKALCENLAKQHIHKVRPSTKNISAMFQYWKDHIFTTENSSAAQLDCMFECICYQKGDSHFAYEHPSKPNTIVVSGVDWAVNISNLRGFFERRERGLTPIEIDALLSMRDRILDDDLRRRQGAFYTPTLWVDEAHKELDKTLGENWRNECIVWDCCAGTGNLTRDYNFANLILSTAEKPDAQAIKREGYNQGAHIFQYDFLNPESPSPFFKKEDGNNVLPFDTRKLLEDGAKAGKRLVFLINPPYATASNAGAKGTAKAGVAQTIANEGMKKAKLGACSQQLYTQFLYQCEQVASEYGYENKSVGVFSPILYMVSGSFAKFRPYWYERYSYQSGFMFQASHFADVKGSWGIGFTIWSEGKTDVKRDLPVTLKDMEDESVISLSEKHLYASDGREASVWVREPVKGLKTFDAPQMKSGLSIGQEGRGKQIAKSLLYFSNNGNSLQDSQTLAYFTSSCGSRAHGLSVLEGEGWRRAIALYSARKLSKDTWVTHNDEYLAPQTDLDGYDQWVDDCHIYALLENKNNMTAMRDITYKGKKHNIHNHFFWLTRAEAMKLYNEHRITNVYRDAKGNPIAYNDSSLLNFDVADWQKAGDPYFASILPNLNLSPLAKEIMEDLQALFVTSLPYRTQSVSVIEKNKSINLHLEAWDAGIYQHKKLWKANPPLKAQWDALNAKHKALATQLQDGVYTYGFLKR